MDIFDLLDQFEQMLEQAPRIPFTGRLVMGEDELIEFVEAFAAKSTRRYSAGALADQRTSSLSQGS